MMRLPETTFSGVSGCIPSKAILVGDGEPALGGFRGDWAISSSVSPCVWQPGSAGMDAE